MRILLVGGGTGGHIIPTLAVARALVEANKNNKILYVGSKKSSDRKLVEEAGFEFVAISSGKFRRYLSLSNFIDVPRIALGHTQAHAVLKSFKPDVVFAKGGYVPLPLLLAAHQRKIPIVLHESDIKLGLSNKVAVGWATKIALSYPIEDCLRVNATLAGRENKLVYTGLPISKNLLTLKPKVIFNNKRPTIFITGGSQGSLFINEMIWAMLPELLAKYNLVHYTGTVSYKRGVEKKESLPQALSKNYILHDFDVAEFQSYLKSSDLVISRSGSSVFELQVLGKLAILIPLPTSANNHQYFNAKFLSDQDAAIMLEQDNLVPGLLMANIEHLLHDHKHAAQMSSKMKKLGKTSILAAQNIAEIIAEVGNAKKRRVTKK